MNRTLRTIFNLRHDYNDPIDQIRARGLFISAILTCILVIIYVGIHLIDVMLGAPLVMERAATGLGLPLGILILFLLQRGDLRIASLIMVGILLLFGGISTLNGVDDAGSSMIIISIVMSSFLFGHAGTLILTFIGVSFIVVGSQFPILPQTTTLVDQQHLLFAAIVLAIASLMRIFDTSMQQFTRKVSVGLAEAAATNHDIANYDLREGELPLLRLVIEHIETDLQFDTAQIYLLEPEGEQVKRVVRTLNILQTTTLPLTYINNTVLEAARAKRAEVINLRDPLERSSHLLAGMQTAIIVPMYSNDQFIGLIDIQSHLLNALDRSMVGILQVIATQLGTMLQHMRMIQTLENDLAEEEHVVLQQRLQLDTLRKGTGKQLAFAPLSEAAASPQDEVMGFDIIDGMLHTAPATDISEEMRQVLDKNELYITLDPETGEQVLTAPIRLREQTIGALNFRMPAGIELNNAQRDLLEGVLERLALAIENRQLFDQSEALARREVRANQIGQVLLSTTDLESVLSLAAENFNSALGAVQTRIRIQPQASKPALRSDSPSRHMDHAEEQA